MVKPEFEHFFETFETVAKNVQNKYDNTTDIDLKQIDNIIQSLENNPNDEEIKICVNTLQQINDKLYEEYGKIEEKETSHPLIDFQVCINKLRNYADVTDESEIIHHAKDGDFVQ